MRWFMVVEINNKAKCGLALKLVKSAAEKFARAHKLGGQELSVAFLSGAEMKKLNRRYRGRDKTTDILSFAGEGDLLGELVMDYAQIKRQAKSYGNSAKQELVFVLVHGLLHLLGYDDKTEAGRLKMIRLGEEFIKNNL
ncbi:MAG: rRNA maturation RNase YbeY [Parcubacteria group bacterium CG1_02_44_65]|nr:MAG: rRNA maturation RNase YbeY [Parcubacteria group bacterium CG1_02_44_65]